MLRIYGVLMELVEDLGPVVRELERQDGELARQMRRALASAPLNVSEGSYSAGGNRRMRYRTAMGSLREALACLEVGAALGYVAPVGEEMRRRFDHVLGTLMKNVRRA